jgi:hypothetical protein
MAFDVNKLLQKMQDQTPKAKSGKGAPAGTLWPGVASCFDAEVEGLGLSSNGVSKSIPYVVCIRPQPVTTEAAGMAFDVNKLLQKMQDQTPKAKSGKGVARCSILLRRRGRRLGVVE